MIVVPDYTDSTNDIFKKIPKLCISILQINPIGLIFFFFFHPFMNIFSKKLILIYIPATRIEKKISIHQIYENLINV